MGSAFIAYFLDDETANQLAVENGEPPENLHITVAFLPDLNEKDFVVVQQLLIDMTEQYQGLKGRVNGVGRFFIDGDDTKDAFLLLPDVIGLPQLRMTLLYQFDLYGIKSSMAHGYIPHITLKFLGEGEKVDLVGEGENTPFSLDRISLVWKNEGGEEDDEEKNRLRIDYPHTGEFLFTKSTVKAGARHNIKDKAMTQSIHDLVCGLGATCAEDNIPYKTILGEDKGHQTVVVLWSEMNFSQRRNALQDAFYDQINMTDESYDYWLSQVFDDYFLVTLYDEQVVYKYTYSILNDKEIVISREGIPGTLEFVPTEIRSVLTLDQAKKSITIGLKAGISGANNLKTLGLTPDEWRVGNYLVLFGGQDLTGEHFTTKTQFESEYTKTDTLIEDWEHGLQPDNVGPTVNEPLGKVLWKATATVDDVGVFVERVLNRQNEYLEALRKLQEEGVISLGSSSEAVPMLVEKSNEGEITKWGLKRDAVTVTPCEPRMLDTNKLASLKQIVGEKIFAQFKSILTLSEDGHGEDERSSYAQRLRLKQKLNVDMR